MELCCCGRLLRSGLLILLIYVSLAFFLGPGFQMQPTNFAPLASPEFHGPFSVNNCLEAAERLSEHQLFGPESLVVKDGVLYTGLADGRIVKIRNGKIETLAKIDGTQCDGTKSEKSEGDKCAAYPLGMRLHSPDSLYVADITKGIYRVSISTGAITPLVASSAVIDGKRLNFPNDLVVSSKGDVYFTEITTKWLVSKWGITAGSLAMAENGPGGRIVHYNAKTKKVRTLLDGLYTPNGIQLSAKEDFLIFAQVPRFNLLKYHLLGPKRGQVEVLVDNLPGLPDNIRPSGRGTFWVSLFAVRLPGRHSFLEKTMPHPCIRCLVYSSLFFARQIIENLQTYIHFSYLDILIDTLTSIYWNSLGDGTYGLVFEMKEDGTIIRSLHSPKGRLNHISQVTEVDDTLYFSSPFNDFIGRLKLYK